MNELLIAIHRMIKLLLVLVTVTVLLGAGAYLYMQSSTPKEALLHGTVRYSERMALPPGSVLMVELKDESAADSEPVTLAKYEYVTAGENVPLPFSLQYNPRKISRKGTYFLYAQISIDGKILWNTDTPVSVLTNARSPEGVDVLVISVPEEIDSNIEVATLSPLANTTWVWQKTTESEGVTEPETNKFVLTFSEKEVTSTTDCNSLAGTYIVAGNNLTFSPFSSTLMFCEDSLEGPYGSALALTSSFTVSEGTLTLMLEGGGVMLFENGVNNGDLEIPVTDPEQEGVINDILSSSSLEQEASSEITQ